MKSKHASTLSAVAAKVASLAALVLAFLPGSSSATTINWGTYIGSSSYLFDSTGANLNDDYVFELGTFGSFTPTQANMSTWLANWKVFDRALAPSGSGWNSAAGIVARSATATEIITAPTDLLNDSVSSNASLPPFVFNQGEQAYIWVYNDTFGNLSPTPSYNAALNWALVTNGLGDGTPSDDWLFPAPSGHVSTTLDWRIEDATFTPFGGLNNNQGPGGFTTAPADFILQTHTNALPIPEPSGALLVIAGSLLSLRRRRSPTT
jgi:hypothetical protein